jgi:hypothetical protein
VAAQLPRESSSSSSSSQLNIIKLTITDFCSMGAMSSEDLSSFFDLETFDWTQNLSSFDDPGGPRRDDVDGRPLLEHEMVPMNHASFAVTHLSLLDNQEDTFEGFNDAMFNHIHDPQTNSIRPPVPCDYC